MDGDGVAGSSPVNVHRETSSREQAHVRLRRGKRSTGPRQTKPLRQRCDRQYRSDRGGMSADARSWARSEGQICLRALRLRALFEEPLG